MKLRRSSARLLLLSPLLLLAVGCGQHRFYVSPSGSDANAGTTPDQAWQTIAKVNSFDFPGDARILFEGGHTFAGGIRLDSADRATPSTPILVGSYGGGRATIEAGDGAGLMAENIAGIGVSDLNFRGSGARSNGASGIRFYNDLPGDVKLERIRVVGVEVSGFGGAGIEVASGRGTSGFRDVQIAFAEAHGNLEAGIRSVGVWPAVPGHAHEDIHVTHSIARDNAGSPGRGRHTGSGIMLSSVDGALIDYNESHGNGGENDHCGGPFGIWVWHANDVTIQFNEAHHNRAGSGCDGGGFDLDGGTTNSVLQYNYSHDNQGPGFLVAQYDDARRVGGLVIRYNISENDARSNGGSIRLWSSPENPYGLEDVQIYNNTIFAAAAPEGAAKAVTYADTPDIVGLRFWNNLLVTRDGVPLVDAHPSAEVAFQGNAYWSSGAAFVVRWGAESYADLASWRAATGQETLPDGQATGLVADPLLLDPGGGGTLGDPTLLPQLRAYAPESGSLLIDAALPLPDLFGLDVGAVDFSASPLPAGAAYDVGAYEAP